MTQQEIRIMILIQRNLKIRNNWWNNEPSIEKTEDDNVEGSRDDNDRDPNGIIQVEEDTTSRRRSYNMGTQRN